MVQGIFKRVDELSGSSLKIGSRIIEMVKFHLESYSLVSFIRDFQLPEFDIGKDCRKAMKEIA